jgi:hypothetical protein
MSSEFALPAVYTAIVARLKADGTLTAMLASAPADIGGAGVYNHVPQKATRPYVLVGSGTEIPFNTMGNGNAAKWGGNCTVLIKAVSQKPSDTEALAILGRVKALLDGQPLTVQGFPDASAQFEDLQPIFTEDAPGLQYPLRHAPAVFRVYAHQEAL